MIADSKRGLQKAIANDRILQKAITNDADCKKRLQKVIVKSDCKKRLLLIANSDCKNGL